MKDIILASASPRRREIMDMLEISYRVVISNVREELDETLSIEERIKSLAWQKANAVFRQHQQDLVIGADTIVELNGEILGKPHNMTEAREMIRKLSGKTHRVITAFAMISDERKIIDCDEALVTFTKISDSEIEEYIQTREPYDKAGGYAIQGWAGKFIEKIEGSYYTVMGLPLHKLYSQLKQQGYFIKQ